MKELRERAGLNTVDVASMLGKSEATIRFWETGKNVPALNPTEYLILLDAYKCTVEELADAAKETREKYDGSAVRRKKGRPPKNK